MSLIMAYYNSRLALWEPLIEPVEGFDNGKRTSTSWELKTKLQFNDLSLDSREASAMSPSCESEPEELINQSSRMSIDIVSSVSVAFSELDIILSLVL